jgi:hypothetical protein
MTANYMRWNSKPPVVISDKGNRMGDCQRCKERRAVRTKRYAGEGTLQVCLQCL